MRGLGLGRVPVVPSGPLRTSLKWGLSRARGAWARTEYAVAQAPYCDDVVGFLRWLSEQGAAVLADE